LNVTKGALAAGHPVTAEAGAAVLREGGSAFDAALAAMAAACVAEPVLASLGGGGFFLAAPAQGAPRVYDFFVQTPKRKRPEELLEFLPVDCDFGPAVQRFHIGLGACATPGVPAGMEAVRRDLCRLTLSQLLQPAIAAAREGVAWRAFDGYALGVVGPIWRYRPETQAVVEGFSERRPLRQPLLADFLEDFGREGARSFYEGEPAARLAALCRERGGHLTREDMEGYRVEVRPALEALCAGSRVLIAPPPSSGGLLIAFALQLAESLGFAEQGAAPDRAALLAAIMQQTNKARVDSGLAAAAEEEAELAALERLQDPDFLALYRERVLGSAAVSRGTTHISVIDAEGNLAAVTLSNGEGCGRLLPGTGIHLNNMLGEEDLNPAGFHAWRPDSRLISMMAPTAALMADGGRLALGSGGSNRLRTAILQVLLGRLAGGLSLSYAVEAPRLHAEGGKISYEPGLPQGAAERLAALGEPDPWPDCSMFFGGVHAAEMNSGGQLLAAADPRRAGVSLVV
jgi:gamma-glutamyltranspeptidase/glutathione hydrolase